MKLFFVCPEYAWNHLGHSFRSAGFTVPSWSRGHPLAEVEFRFGMYDRHNDCPVEAIVVAGNFPPGVEEFFSTRFGPDQVHSCPIDAILRNNGDLAAVIQRIKDIKLKRAATAA